MYEMGIAISCRQQNEIIILKDDKDDVPFDINNINYEAVDFNNAPDAITTVRDLISSRIAEIEYLYDIRTQQAISKMTIDEVRVLKNAIELLRERFSKGKDNSWIAKLYAGQQFFELSWEACDNATIDTNGNSKYSRGVPLLLDKGLIEVSQIKPDSHCIIYNWTVFGCEIAKYLFKDMIKR